jgi:hypothetical protein
METDMTTEHGSGQPPANIQPKPESDLTAQHGSGQQLANVRPNLAAVPHPEEQGAPARLRRGLGRSLRGRRPGQRAIRALVIEQLLIGGRRLASTTSYAENVIRARGKAGADRVLTGTQRVLGGLAKKSDALRAQQATLRTRADYRDDEIITHPDGGVRTVAQTARDQDEQRELIAADIQRGSRRHRRMPAALRRVPLLVFTADGLLLLYFFSGITNVNWGNPLSMALLFAGLLAAMVTGISFAFFRFTGDRLQQYKDDTGTIPLRGLDEATNTSMALAAGAMIVLAVMMYLRMRAEVIDALGHRAGFTAIIIGLTLALVSILANTLVIAVHALDGSAEADRLDALGQAVAPALAHQHQLREQADTLAAPIAVIGREAERTAGEGITAAGHQYAIADQIIDAARAVHQGTGPLSDPAANPNNADGAIGYRRADAAPQADHRSTDFTLTQIRTPLPDDDQAAA